MELTDKLRAAGEAWRGTELGGLLQWAALHIEELAEVLSESQAAHAEAAAGLLKTGGKLVAILPESARSFEIPGMVCFSHGPYTNEFAGTSVSVVILEATHETN